MDKEYYTLLAKVRLERAAELLEEAQTLLGTNAYKSANNRAFYAIEKAIKALLALKETDVITHNGTLKQFNFLFVFQGDGTFGPEDYQKIARAEQIRNASDYDDFYQYPDFKCGYCDRDFPDALVCPFYAAGVWERPDRPYHL